MERIELETLQDVYKLFNSWVWNPEKEPVDPGGWNKRRWEYSNIVGIGAYMIEKSFQDVIRRKTYCKDYPTVAPFPGTYDDQPEWWLDTVSRINAYEAEAINSMRK